MPSKLSCLLFTLISLTFLFAAPRLQAQTATQTVLTAVTGGFAQETLTATVSAGSASVYPGIITFTTARLNTATCEQLAGSERSGHGGASINTRADHA